MTNYKNKIYSQLKSKIVYNAILLDKASKQQLEKKFPPRHAKTYDGHVTLEFKPSEYPDNLGKEVIVKVFGYGEDDKASAVAVQVFDVNCENEIPHITISTSQNTPPSYSSELLSKGYQAIEPFDLKGKIVSFVSGKGYVDHLEEENNGQGTNFNKIL